MKVEFKKRINAFSRLGEFLRLLGNDALEDEQGNNNVQFKNLVKVIEDSYLHNGWFLEENVRHMLLSLGKSMTKTSLEEWTSKYQGGLDNENKVKTVAVVMAGNIPAVGFHDWLTVLMSGNRVLAKLSSDDNKLIPAISELLISIEPEFESLISFTDGKLSDFDAVIATGSGNTGRYFDYYFGKYQNIIRKNRNGVAVLSGNETTDDFEQLADDVFMYFGLGCRNVSKLFVPKNYDFTPMLDVFSKREEISNHHKYFNNYEYNKAIYLVNSRPHLDAGNILLVEDNAFASPVSVLYYEEYSDLSNLNRRLMMEQASIQCVISHNPKVNTKLVFGQSQQPQLWDYADGVDTVEFLIGLD